MKNVLIFGASGTFGPALINQLISDTGYHVTAVSRHANKHLKATDQLSVVDADANDYSEVEKLVENTDVVYCAVSGFGLPQVAENIIKAMAAHNKQRLILMGAVGIYNEIPDEMDGQDNVCNNPDQVPNRKAVDIVEQSNLRYTVLRPGYLVDGDESDFVLTFKGEAAKGFHSTIPSVVNLAVKLIAADNMYVGESVSITKDYSK